MEKRILIIDDEPDVRGLLKVRLTANRFQVLEAGDGPSGISIAKQNKPDLILLDILMPGMGGIETYRALKSDPVTQDTPIIFLTALAQSMAPTESRLKGYAMLGKPYQPEELLQEIRKNLGE